MKKMALVGMLAVLMGSAYAQNYNNGEDLSRFVTSDAFSQMTAEQLLPVKKKVQTHLDQCVAATVKHLQKNGGNGVSAKQLQTHYQLWVPYYQSTCDVYATEQEEEAAARSNLKMRCEVFSQSSFYSSLLAYQRTPLPECQ